MSKAFRYLDHILARRLKAMPAVTFTDLLSPTDRSLDGDYLSRSDTLETSVVFGELFRFGESPTCGRTDCSARKRISQQDDCNLDTYLWQMGPATRIQRPDLKLRYLMCPSWKSTGQLADAFRKTRLFVQRVYFYDVFFVAQRRSCAYDTAQWTISTVRSPWLMESPGFRSALGSVAIIRFDIWYTYLLVQQHV
jgi:hypothetical protein